MRTLFRAYVMRVPPLRWLWALAVSLYGFVKTVPIQFVRHVGRVNKALKHPSQLPTTDQRSIMRAVFKRFRRRLRNIRQHRRSVLGQLNGDARNSYLGALRELTNQGETVGRERLARLNAVATAGVHELKLAAARGRAAEKAAQRDAMAMVVDAMPVVRRAA